MRSYIWNIYCNSEFKGPFKKSPVFRSMWILFHSLFLFGRSPFFRNLRLEKIENGTILRSWRTLKKIPFSRKKGQSSYHLCVKAAGVYYYTKCRSAERRLRSSANYIFQYKNKLNYLLIITDITFSFCIFLWLLFLF